MRFQDALKELKYKRTNRFVLGGPEPYLKDRFIKITKSLNPDLETLDLRSDNSDEVVSVLYSGGLFGKRLIIIRELEKVTSKKFYQALSDSNDLILMLLSDSVDKKSKGLTEIVGVSEFVECNKMRIYGNDYVLWILSKTSESGYKLEGDADKMIYERTGPSMFVISNELKKLYLYKGDNRIITEEDVKKVVSNISASNIYSVLERLLHRDVSGAFYCLDSYNKTHESNMEIMRFFCDYLEKMYRLLLFREQGLSVDDMAEILGLPKFLVKIRYLPRAISFGKMSLAKCLDWAEELDYQVRVFKFDKSVLIDRFVIRFSE
jgi:DNA polymerase-3 subunit delta